MSFLKDLKKFGQKIKHTGSHLADVVNHDLGKLVKPITHSDLFFPKPPKDFKKTAEIVGGAAVLGGIALVSGGLAIPEEAALLAGGAEGGLLADLGLGSLSGIGTSLASAGSKIGTALSVGGTLLEVSEMIKISSQEDKLEDKLFGIGVALTKLGSFEEAEHSQLAKFGGVLETIGDSVGALKGLKVALEAKGKKEITQLSRLNEQVKENHGTLEVIKSQSLILPQSLQALDTDIKTLTTENIEVEGAIRQLQTRIDRPLSVSDIVNDLNMFDRPTDMLNYIAENAELLQTLPSNEMNRVLDLLLDGGALASL